MSWVKKRPHNEATAPASRSLARRSSEQAANDSLGNYLLPSLRGIEVQELSREEFEALLNGQTQAV